MRDVLLHNTGNCVGVVCTAVTWRSLLTVGLMLGSHEHTSRHVAGWSHVRISVMKYLGQMLEPGWRSAT